MEAIAVILPIFVRANQFSPLLPPETPIDEVRGYELHSLQLIRPYNNAPNWDLRGDAFISRNKVRLTREAQSLNGSIWSRNRLSSRDWEIQADLRIYSSSDPPADGIAIWYIEKPSTGSAWGGPKDFSGIAVEGTPQVNFGVTQRHDLRGDRPHTHQPNMHRIEPPNMAIHELLILSYELETPHHFSSGPVDSPMYIGFRPEPTTKEEEYTFWENFFYYLEITIFVVLVMGTLYGMYYVTDKLIDDNFIMARPRKRFY
ncbi:Legume-like lectin family protein [Oesophagostomum dentatum]|uniref:Legume-like lectin family protein n=1 Tax=Oesophagostomum dentatum TaxID=61180 RepID=A0A0B1TQP7_OESDE|nr:Legume-like lectin family protein [Oesophagostomum dentatum]